MNDDMGFNLHYRSKKTRIIFHILVWLVLFSLPYVLSSGEGALLENVFIHSWVPLLGYMLLFYVNYLYLNDKFLFQKKFFIFFIVNIVLIILLWWGRNEIIESYFSNPLPSREKGFGRPPKQLFVYVQLISFAMPVIFAIGLESTERWIKSDNEKKVAQNIKLNSELELLRYQLQPHFFFNSLNNIYSLIDISPEQAKSTTHSLSKLMRYLLYDTNEAQVPLRKELDFIERYVELMKLRVSSNVKVELDLPEITNNIELSPLLFISLVENAFKHGVSASKDCLIIISMSIKDSIIYFTCENDYFPKKENDRSGSGIGVKNLQKRLDLLYAGKYKFTNEMKDGRHVSNLEINLANE